VDVIDVPLHWLGILVCVLAISLAAAAEAALSAISRRQLNGLHHSSRATLVYDLINDAYRFKVSLLLINTMALIGLTALSVGLVQSLPLWYQFGWLLVLTVSVILFAEALPKAVALRNPAATAKFIAEPFYLCMLLLRPLIICIDFIARRLFTPAGSDDLTPIVTEEELLSIVNVGQAEGLLEPNEREMIKDIITFGDTLVREIMIPRVDIITINTVATSQEAIALITRHGHSRIPVIRESSDRIIGILYAKDLLASLQFGHKPTTIATLMRYPYYVPEMIKIDTLLHNMQTKRVHFAVVVDEYGATTGIVTLEDILEEIVGEINDEFDPTILADIVWEGPHNLTVDARVLLDDINDHTGLTLSSETSDRIGGFIAEKLGRMSEIGDVVTYFDDATFAVIAVDGIRTSRIRITIANSQRGRDDYNQPPATY
jgi:putative hemolysin